jgi:hypothetical protein
VPPAALHSNFENTPAPGRLSIEALGFRSGESVLTASPVRVTSLRCEYLNNLLGIDVRQPRLSWRLEAPARGARPTACQVARGHRPAAPGRRPGRPVGLGPDAVGPVGPPGLPGPAADLAPQPLVAGARVG